MRSALFICLLLAGCGTAISVTYTPPMTVGLTVDMRAAPTTQGAPK